MAFSTIQPRAETQAAIVSDVPADPSVNCWTSFAKSDGLRKSERNATKVVSSLCLGLVCDDWCAAGAQVAHFQLRVVDIDEIYGSIWE